MTDRHGQKGTLGGLVSAAKRLRKDTGVYLKELPTYLYAKLRSKTYMEYQSDRYDGIYRKNPQTFRQKDRTFQLEYCKRHGLQPSTNLLDYGCGPLAAGIAFIEYLEPSRYTGADISSEALKLARRFVEAEGLSAKLPRLIHLPHGDLSPLDGTRYDFVWAQSVFTHMAPEDVERVVLKLPALLSPHGKFLATFNIADAVRIEHFKNWNFTADFFAQLTEKAGMRSQILQDFQHPSAIDRKHRALSVVAITHR